jgi:hypothetical protein
MKQPCEPRLRVVELPNDLPEAAERPASKIGTPSENVAKPTVVF